MTLDQDPGSYTTSHMLLLARFSLKLDFQMQILSQECFMIWDGKFSTSITCRVGEQTPVISCITQQKISKKSKSREISKDKKIH